MTDERDFPKIDGDVLYASEVNSFFPKIIGNVEYFTGRIIELLPL